MTRPVTRSNIRPRQIFAGLLVLQVKRGLMKVRFARVPKSGARWYRIKDVIGPCR